MKICEERGDLFEGAFPAKYMPENIHGKELTYAITREFGLEGISLDAGFMGVFGPSLGFLKAGLKPKAIDIIHPYTMFNLELMTRSFKKVPMEKVLEQIRKNPKTSRAFENLEPGESPYRSVLMEAWECRPEMIGSVKDVEIYWGDIEFLEIPEGLDIAVFFGSWSVRGETNNTIEIMAHNYGIDPELKKRNILANLKKNLNDGGMIALISSRYARAGGGYSEKYFELEEKECEKFEKEVENLGAEKVTRVILSEETPPDALLVEF